MIKNKTKKIIRHIKDHYFEVGKGKLTRERVPRQGTRFRDPLVNRLRNLIKILNLKVQYICRKLNVELWGPSAFLFIHWEFI